MEQPTELSHVFAALKTIPKLNQDQQKHFVATADFAVREFLIHYSKIYPEALRIARKVAESGDDKPAVAVVSYALKVHFTNLDHLKVEANSAVTPYKLKCSGEVDEDMKQMKFDFDAGTMERIDGEAVALAELNEGEPEAETPETETPAADAPGYDLASQTIDQLKLEADGLGIEYKVKVKKTELIEAITAARAKPENVHAFPEQQAVA